MRFRAVRKEYANLPVFADIGAGAMRSLGIALAMAQVEVRHLLPEGLNGCTTITGETDAMSIGFQTAA